MNGNRKDAECREGCVALCWWEAKSYKIVGVNQLISSRRKREGKRVWERVDVEWLGWVGLDGQTYVFGGVLQKSEKEIMNVWEIVAAGIGY